MPKGAVRNHVFYYTAPSKLEVRQEDCLPPGPGQVRGRTISSLVSIGTEMICFARQVEKGSGWDQWIQYPFEPGYLTVGEITDVGEGVTAVKVGQRVCSVAAHRAWFLDKPETLIPVPDGLHPHQANWFFLNSFVQNGIREVKPALGETAVVIGLGPLGQIAVRLLGLMGLRHLIAIDPLESRCKLAEGNGPTEVWAGRADQLADKVHERTRGLGAEMVFDITGHPAVFHAAHKMLGKRGRLGLIGDVPAPALQTMSSDAFNKAATIICAKGSIPTWEGNHYYRWGHREMSDIFFHFILTGRIRMAELNTHVIDPLDAPRVYPDIYEHREKYMGVIIDWEKAHARA